MCEVQETEDDRHRGGDFYTYQQAPRLLEDTAGEWGLGIELNNGGRKTLARAEGVRLKPIEVHTEKGALAGTAYFIDHLYWEHTQALLFTEGGATQILIGPGYLFVDGERSAPYDPRPHLKKVLLAAISKAPEGMSLLEAFSELRRWSC
jgi:hypothetical protein